MAAPDPPLPAVNKLVLAVHGIGDQTRNSTILSTATRFCEHFNYRALLPLGGFYGTLQDNRPPFVIANPSPTGPLQTIGFAEIYWADLAREIETAGYTLQETKEWCRSLASRIRVLAERKEPGRTDIHYGQIDYVLGEAVDAIGVIESLLFLARKAGVLEFDLKKILDDYLGDVQLVTEFATVRDSIVKRLDDALLDAHLLYPEAEIYIAAHSEGTVVSWLGLLLAATYPAGHPWISQVRGYMTIGSPIDKHLILWPDLFTRFKGPDLPLITGQSNTANSVPPIRWLNYVDNGDPVGFELDTARWWMKEKGYDRVFNFTAADDYYFTRYPVPGKAHTDYWNDDDVFQHFIMNVVAPPQSRDDPPPIARREALKNGPRSKLWALITSYVVAYLIPLVAVFAAVYFLSKGVEQYLDPKDELPHPSAIRNVFAMGGLLAGVTVWLRITQLVRSWLWYAVGAVVYVAFATLFYFLVENTRDLAWVGALPSLFGDKWGDPKNGLLLISAGLIVAVMLSNARWLRRLWNLLFPRTASLGAVAKSPTHMTAPDSASSEKSVSHRPAPPIRNTLSFMLLLGGVALAANAVVFAQLNPPAAAPSWPMVMGAAAFLFLWRLAALVFDLIFIWHRYIRHSGAMTFLRHAILPASAAQTPGATGGRRAAKK